MREYEGTWSHQTQGCYRNSTADKISEPEDFWYLGYINKRSIDWVKAQTIIRLQPREEDWDFKKLQARYERPQSIATKMKAPEGPIRPSVDKGKQKESGKTLQKDEYSHFHDHWHNDYADVLEGTRDTLPPWHEVNHEIHLVDPSKWCHYHLPQCPNSLRDEFYTKINRYVNSGWWEPKSVSQVALMLCLKKEDNHLQMVINAQQQNKNTIKDVTPLLDPEVIHKDVARGKIWSKINLSDAYEQVCVCVEDVDKTMFAIIMGTYVSHIMQQGNCNAPATFQNLMTLIFHNVIGHSVYVYLDDILHILQHTWRTGKALERSIWLITIKLSIPQVGQMWPLLQEYRLLRSHHQWSGDPPWHGQISLHCGLENPPWLQWHPMICGSGQLCGKFSAWCNNLHWTIDVYDTEQCAISLAPHTPTMLWYDQTHMSEDTNHTPNKPQIGWTNLADMWCL